MLGKNAFGKQIQRLWMIDFQKKIVKNSDFKWAVQGFYTHRKQIQRGWLVDSEVDRQDSDFKWQRRGNFLRVGFCHPSLPKNSSINLHPNKKSQVIIKWQDTRKLSRRLIFTHTHTHRAHMLQRAFCEAASSRSGKFSSIWKLSQT